MWRLDCRNWTASEEGHITLVSATKEPFECFIKDFMEATNALGIFMSTHPPYWMWLLYLPYDLKIIFVECIKNDIMQSKAMIRY